jgi:hypothetical protein
LPKAGEIRVRLTTAEAAAAAEWLLGRFLERGWWGRRPPDEDDQKRATKLGQQLLKIGTRKRSVSAFTVCVDRELASWFGALDVVISVEGIVLAAGAPHLLRRAMRRFRAASGTGRGRPRLPLSAVEERETGAVRHLDPRQRKRMARRARHERTVAEWHARGRSIAGSAGSDDPYPKM